MWPSVVCSFFAGSDFYGIMHASERNHGTTQPGIGLIVACLLGLMGLALFAVRPAYGQENEQAQPSQPQWAAGVQFFPVPGVSVRRALTSRIAVQVSGIPDVGDHVFWFRGGMGGRLLYRFKMEGANSLYASGAYSLFFLSPQFLSTTPGEDFLSRRERRSHFGAVTLGTEIALGYGMSLSLEGGVARIWGHGLHRELGWEEEYPRSTLAGGIGLHYRWGSP